MDSIFKKIKIAAAPYLHQASFLTGASLNIANRRSGLRIIMYHGVGAADCPTNVFLSQMEYLAKNFQVISLNEALSRSKNREFHFDKQVVLTFDDGLKNNFSVVYPVLKRLALPATFFICPGLIESGSWVWAYEIGQRLLSCNRNEFDNVKSLINVPVNNVDDPNDLPASVEWILEWMKTLWIGNRKEIENAIRNATKHYAPSVQEEEAFDNMTWDQLKMLSKDIITIGSHSISHPILTKISYDEMVYEIVESKKWLETELNRQIELFCYPNGIFDEKIVDVVKNNYIAAVGTEPGFSHVQDNFYKMNRIPAAEDMPLLAWRLFRPTA